MADTPAARADGHRETPTIASVAARPEAWGWAMASGIALVLAGLVALSVPGRTTVAIAFFLGWVLVLAGAVGVVMGFRTHLVRRRLIDWLYGASSLAVGGVCLANPRAGAYTVTAAFAFWLVLRGATEFVGAVRAGAGRLRGALVALGLFNWLLAALLLALFPSPAIKAIGLFVGLSLLVGGGMTIAAAWQLRRLAHP